MNPDRLILDAGMVAFPLVMGGLLVRGLYRTCWTFLPYLVAVWVGDIVVFAFPKHHTWDFYLAKESVVSALRVLLAVELYERLFAGLPRARRIGNVPVLASLTLTLVLLWTSGFKPDPVRSFQTLMPIASDGTTLILTTVLALATWFQVPAEPLHRAILRGLVAYLLVYTLGIHLFVAFGWASRPVLNRIMDVSYNILLLFWTLTVWQSRSEDPAPPAVVRRLRTWASSS